MTTGKSPTYRLKYDRVALIDQEPRSIGGTTLRRTLDLNLPYNLGDRDLPLADNLDTFITCFFTYTKLLTLPARRMTTAEIYLMRTNMRIKTSKSNAHHP